MTVIACDGKMLAADTQGSSNGARIRVSKIRRIKGGWMGVSGLASGIDAMQAWIDGGCKEDERPPIQHDDGSWCRALVMWDDGRVWLVERWGPIVVQPPAAIGSGQDFALAAMALGLDAASAVGLTCQLSTECGLPVEKRDIGEEA